MFFKQQILVSLYNNYIFVTLKLTKICGTHKITSNMKNRECPYCHKKISLRHCLLYIYRGTNYSTTCNHCGKEVKLIKEPIPFMYCVCAGFLSVSLPSYFLIYQFHWTFIKAVLSCLPFVIFSFIICTILTFKNLFFKKTE